MGRKKRARRLLQRPGLLAKDPVGQPDSRGKDSTGLCGVKRPAADNYSRKATIRALENATGERAFDIALKLSARPGAAVENALFKKLRTTRSLRAKEGAALALADLGSKPAGEYLRKWAKSSKPMSATLIHALSSYEPRSSCLALIRRFLRANPRKGLAIRLAITACFENSKGHQTTGVLLEKCRTRLREASARATGTVDREQIGWLAEVV